MNGKQALKRRIVASSSTVLVVLGLLVAFAGSASAAPLAPDGAATVAWAYGGQNTTNGSATFGNVSVSWSLSLGDVLIFNATPTGPTTTELSAQRTVGIAIHVTASAPGASLAFDYRATEVDRAYANLTNASTVYVGGHAVPALGLDNSSFHGTASLAESLVASAAGQQVSGYLNVSADARSSVQFAPALGLIPLNLSGNPMWNSTATASPNASWSIGFDYALHGLNNSSGAGSASTNGSWNATGPVFLTGAVLPVYHWPAFRDHAPRLAIVLVVSGPMDLYDGFVVIPHAFDLFGGAPHHFDADSMSTVAFSHERLFLSPGHVRASALTAATDQVGAAAVVGASGPMAAAPNGYATGVAMQPESVAQAQAQSHCVASGCPAGATPFLHGLGGLVLVGGLIAAVAGTVGVVEWRSYARRKQRATQLVGGYGEPWTHGVPPAVAQPPSAPSTPTNGPSTTESFDGTGRQL